MARTSSSASSASRVFGSRVALAVASEVRSGRDRVLIFLLVLLLLLLIIFLLFLLLLLFLVVLSFRVSSLFFSLHHPSPPLLPPPFLRFLLVFFLLLFFFLFLLVCLWFRFAWQRSQLSVTSHAAGRQWVTPTSSADDVWSLFCRSGSDLDIALDTIVHYVRNARVLEMLGTTCTQMHFRVFPALTCFFYSEKVQSN